MTNDLVKCLRARVNGGMHWVTVERMAAEAADRIEQLEAALQRANATAEEYERKFYLGSDHIEQLEGALREKDNIAYVIDSHGISHDTFTIVYRAALGEKKDG